MDFDGSGDTMADACISNFGITQAPDLVERECGKGLASKPQNRRYRHRATLHAHNVREALAMIEDGTCERVYVAGAKPDTAELLADLSGYPSASVYLDGHWPTVRLGGRSIHWSAQWTGNESWGPFDAAWFMQALASDIRRHFGATATLLATPATTGRDLWLRTIRREWPVMSEQAQRIVRATSTQGRIETFGTGTTSRVVAYDMRAAYTAKAVLAELPVGEPEQLDVVDAYGLLSSRPYARARYRLNWAAPRGWRHPGMLPMRDEHSGARTFPLLGVGWVDGSEMLAAVKAGWMIAACGDESGLAALYWPEQGDPFGRWGAILRERMANADRRENREMRHAWRAILIQAIGAFHGSARRVTVIGSDPPANVENVSLLPDGRVRWTERTHALWRELSHPEWSAAIWARVRTRLLVSPVGGMLAVPPERILGCRTDAIYLTEPENWPDDGEAGRYRLKADVTLTKPLQLPASGAELLSIVRGL
jgi:hypothetical protein